MPRTQSQIEEFKDSPIGRIPKDWDVKPLSEVADVDRGKFTHRPRNDPRFYRGIYPFIQTGDIAKASGAVITTYSQTLNERGIGVSREFPVGTIAITIAANIADTAILGIPMFFPDSVVGAVVKEPNSIRYVELCIHRAKQLLDARAPQSAQKNINLEDLRPLLIPVPSPEDQHKISEVIDTIDSTIAHTSTLIAKLKQMKAGLLHDLLTRGLDENGELRDAIDRPEQFKDSPLGQIPKEWDVKPLSTLTESPDSITYGVLKPGDYVSNGIPLLQIQDVIHGTIQVESIHRIGRELDSQYARTRLFGGEIVMSLVGTIGKVAQIPDWLTGANLHRNLARIAISPEQSSRFYFHYLQTPRIQQAIKMTTFGSTQSLLNLADLRNLLVVVPSLKEQQAISLSIDAHDKRFQTEEAYLNKLKEQKKGLMHDLLTGRVRVTNLKEISA